jgi:hypothetical protein
MSILHPEILGHPGEGWKTRLLIAVVVLLGVLFASSPAWSSFWRTVAINSSGR